MDYLFYFYTVLSFNTTKLVVLYPRQKQNKLTVTNYNIVSWNVQ